jgi:hypothetical protein
MCLKVVAVAQSIKQLICQSEGPRFKPRDGQNFFLGEISTLTPCMVSVRSVKNGISHCPRGGITVAVKSAKVEIRVSENRTLGLRRCEIYSSGKFTYSENCNLPSYEYCREMLNNGLKPEKHICNFTD